MLETTYITLARRGYKRILCEDCGLIYFYEMQVQTEGEATSIALIGRREASRQASERAVKRLNDRFEKRDDPVPCPDCGHVQDNMLRTLIRKHSKRKRFNSVALLGIGYLFLQFSFCFVFFDSSTCFVTHIVAPAIGLILVSFGIRLWMQYRGILKSDADDPRYEEEIAAESGRGASTEDLLPRLCKRSIRLRRRISGLEKQRKTEPDAEAEEWEELRMESESINGALYLVTEVTSKEYVDDAMRSAEEEVGRAPEPKPWTRPNQSPE